MATGVLHEREREIDCWYGRCEGEIREREEGDRVFVWCERCEMDKWE